ncbi:MAG: IclR family transcriptional regulator [Deltaproteobacteria bacterium]|nr:IclR family transcriptional regulator [Deltaproteobacteria bacterium]
MSDTITTHRAVEKTLDILMLFVPHNREMGTFEISERTGFHKSTTSRLLHVLVKKGFLRQGPQNKKFQLGPSAMAIGVSIKRSLETNLVHIAKPLMDDLRDALSETIALEVFSGTNTVLAYLSEGPHRTKFAGNVGDILSVHAAAGAKAILAFSSPEVKGRILRGPFPALTPHTITDPKALQRTYQEIRRLGLSFDNEEHDLGTNAMGAPIFDNSGKPVAALVVVGPRHRVQKKYDSPIAQQLKETSAKISRLLFYNPENAGRR